MKIRIKYTTNVRQHPQKNSMLMGRVIAGEEFEIHPVLDSIKSINKSKMSIAIWIHLQDIGYIRAYSNFVWAVKVA